MQELLSLLGIGGGGLLTKEAYDKLGDVGDTAMDMSQDIGSHAQGMNEFTGYGVTGPGGSTQVGADGSTSMSLNPEQQAYADQALGASSGLMESATGSQAGREQDIYERIRAMQQPGEDRQRSALESRQLQQGLMGMSTNQYGGTPAQHAMEMAQAEARNNAAYQAIGEARTQQRQDADMSNLFGQMQYAPQSALLDIFGAGSNAYGYEDVARRSGANLWADAAMGGLDAKLGATLGQGNLMGGLGSSMITGGMGMLGGIANQGGDFLEGLTDTLKSWI